MICACACEFCVRVCEMIFRCLLCLTYVQGQFFKFSYGPRHALEAHKLPKTIRKCHDPDRIKRIIKFSVLHRGNFNCERFLSFRFLGTIVAISCSVFLCCVSTEAFPSIHVNIQSRKPNRSEWFVCLWILCSRVCVKWYWIFFCVYSKRSVPIQSPDWSVWFFNVVQSLIIYEAEMRPIHNETYVPHPTSHIFIHPSPDIISQTDTQTR